MVFVQKNRRRWWNGIHVWFKIKCLFGINVRLVCVEIFLMTLFLFFDDSFFFNLGLFCIGFYLTVSIFFGVFCSNSQELAFPNILPAFLFFSTFILVFIFFTISLDLAPPIQVSSFFLFNQLFLIIFLVASILTLVITRSFISCYKISKFEYDLFFSFVILGSICLCFADDFLQIYLAIELQSLCLYVFATFNRNSEFSTESGLKYFVFGAIISCFLLLGFYFIYFSFGSTSLEILFSLIKDSNDSVFFLGSTFVLLALFFKVGAVPFHFWLCDVYDGSLLSVTLLFSAVPKIIIFCLLIKLFLIVNVEFQNFWSPLFLFSGVLSIVVGSVSALFQKRLKRLLAYSTISHTGFILLALIAVSPASTKAMVFYLVVYSLLTLLIFSLLIFVTCSLVKFPGYLVNWTANGVKNITLICTLSLTLFSIAGIPPLVGFFSKFFILSSVVSSGFFITATIVVVISSIGCFYYVRLIKMFFFTKQSKNGFWVSSTRNSSLDVAISVLFFFNVFFIFKPELLSLFSLVASLSII